MMDKELTKAKMKMTKSIVLQMQAANTAVLRDGEVLGYVVNIDKYTHRTIIIKYMDNYYRMVVGFEKGIENTKVIRRAGKYSWNQYFNTAEDRDEYMRYYDAIIKKLVNGELTQIYV